MTNFMHALARKIANIFGTKQHSRNTWSIHDPELRHCVARPSTVYPRCAWSAENILVLILSKDNDVESFAKSLSKKGADVSFEVISKMEDIFYLPLEQYTMVIMGTGASEPDIHVADIGGVLRRADHSLTLVWASSQFKISIASDSKRHNFCDIQFSVPTLPETLSAAMGWSNETDPSRN